MKRKFWYVFAALVCGTVCAFILAACVAGNNGTHTHNWSSIYTADGDRHYQTCDGCDEKLYGEHDYGTDGVCVCGAAEPVDGHSHNYEWVDNGDGTHKQHCSVSGCPHPDVNVGSHDYGVNGVCVCGAVKPSDTHTQYNVIFNANGGKIDGKDTKTVVGAVNQTVSRPNDPVRTDYTFTGWYKDGATTTPWNFDTDTVKGATTLYAGWQMNVTEYDVTFVHNYPNSANVVKTTENGLITYIPKRTGYIFNGWWYSDGEINGNYILSEKFDTAEKVTQSGITLYAEWVQQRTDNSQLYSPSVSISADGVFSWQAVTGAQGYRVEVYSGSSKTVEETTAKTSWSFPNGSAAGYYTVKIRANGNGENTINSAYTEKYYAHHMLGNVDWRFNNATSIMTWDAVKNATAYEIRINNTLKDTITYTTYDLSALDAGDYTVSVKATRKDWQSATPMDYSLTKKRLRAPNVTVTQNSDCTYTVSWKAVAKADTYRIKHHDTYITVTETSYTVNNDSPIYNPNGTGGFTVCAYDSNADYFISGDSESFEIKKLYSVALNKSDDAAGVVLSAKQTYKVGESVTISASTNRGYTWLGWYDGNTKLTDNLSYTFTMPSKNLTYTAKWAQYTLTVNCTEGGTVSRDDGIYSYTVDFDLNGGTGTAKSQTVTVDVGLKYPEKPTRSGYLFGGWYDNAECIGIPYDFSQNVVRNLTLYAKWLSYDADRTIPINYGYVSRILRAINYSTPEYYAFVPIANGKVTIDCTRIYGSGAFYIYDSEKNLLFNRDFSISSKSSFNVTAGQLYYACCLASNLNSANSSVEFDLKQDIPFNGKVSSSVNGVVALGTSVTLSATTNAGYTWLGWYNGNTKLTNKLNYTFTVPANNVTYTAKWEVDERLKNFTFTATTNAITITGVVDNAVSSIIVPDIVTNIDKSAFSGCSSLTSITLPFVGEAKEETTNTHFGYIFGASNAANNSNFVPSSLKTVIITSKKSIDRYAFYECNGLMNITIPDNVTSIGEYAFRGCSGLTSITIPNSVTSISGGAFYGCNSLKSITIPNSVTSIDGDAFYGCSKLTIYCEAANKPSSWNINWNPSNRPVVWDCKNQ